MDHQRGNEKNFRKPELKHENLPRTFFDMYYVYLLQSRIKIKKFYIGSTGDLKRRFYEHNTGKLGFTARYKPWKIIYYEAFISEKDARKREHALKHHGKGVSELKKRLEYSYNHE